MFWLSNDNELFAHSLLYWFVLLTNIYTITYLDKIVISLYNKQEKQQKIQSNKQTQVLIILVRQINEDLQKSQPQCIAKFI